MVQKTKTVKKRKASKGKKRKKKTLKVKLIKAFLYCCICVIFSVFCYVLYCFATLPDIDDALSKTRQPSTTIVAENGNEIQTFGNSFSSVVYLDDLPDYVPEAVISIEDRRFYKHFGFDPIGLGRAVLTNMFKKRYAQGASTITQQVAKNLFLTPQKSLKRKIQELLIALWLERKFTKDQILMLYFNRVYLGAGIYGIEAAANTYFNKSSRDLTLKDAAVIAGMLKAPSKYNPIYSIDNANKRANVVLDVMFNMKVIDKQSYLKAKSEPIVDARRYKVEGAKHFSDMVYAEVNAYIGERDQDIYVRTTLDQNLQEKAEKILRQKVSENKKNNVSEGALVVLDYTGAVKALVGGVDYRKNQFNRATQALRQPGSAFKTFVYITALQHGFEPEDKILDAPVQIGSWKPENFNKKYMGEVSLDFAFSQSLNAATANLSKHFRLSDVIKNAKKMGLTSRLQNTPSLVLGTSEVKVIDMAAAYLSIANGGFASWPYFIEEIYAKSGEPLYERIHDENLRVLDEKTVSKITKMLENVVLNGTGQQAKLPFFVAGKTGTTQNFKDAWFVGFTSKYVAAVWIGNDDNAPMKNVTGGSLPAHIFKEIMR